MTRMCLDLQEPPKSSRSRLRTAPPGRASARPLVVLTVDTEPDDAWTNHQNPSVANVQQLSRLQEVLDRFGASATLLVTYRVVQDAAAVRMLQRLAGESGAEIGAHLHPWENPPFLSSRADVRYPSLPHELPLSAFGDKLSVLTDAIAERFGRPTSYRAGRWGLSAEHLPVLERLGYEAETSVTPWIDWRCKAGIPLAEGGCGGVDFRSAPRCPYHPSYQDVNRPGSATILEIPVSVTTTRRVPETVANLSARLPNLARRALRKCGAVRPVWAMPAWERTADLKQMLAVTARQSPPVFNIALHSSELMVDGSPKSRSVGDTDAVFEKIELLLTTLAADSAATFATLSEAALQLRQRQITCSN